MTKLLLGCLVLLSFSVSATPTASTDNHVDKTNENQNTTNVGSLSQQTSKGFNGLAGKSSEIVKPVPVEKVIVSPIDPNAVRTLLREHIPHLQYCYQKALESLKNPEEFKGRIEIKFKINTSGKAESSQVTSVDFPSNSVEDCMNKVINGIQFPEPKGGKTVEVNQPMNLYPKKK